MSRRWAWSCERPNMDVGADKGAFLHVFYMRNLQAVFLPRESQIGFRTRLCSVSCMSRSLLTTGLDQCRLDCQVLEGRDLFSLPFYVPSTLSPVLSTWLARGLLEEPQTGRNPCTSCLVLPGKWEWRSLPGFMRKDRQPVCASCEFGL